MAIDIRPRDFVTLLGDAAASQRAARAQQPAVPVVGYFYPAMPELVAAFWKGFSETGYVEVRNVILEYA